MEYIVLQKPTYRQKVVAANQPFAVSTVAYIENLNYNDYYEIWVTSISDGDRITVQDVNAFFYS